MDGINIFQSTLSVRRATGHGHTVRRHDHISIHALREESDGTWSYVTIYETISIHALREESDTHASALGNLVVISIHALREESDTDSE